MIYKNYFLKALAQKTSQPFENDPSQRKRAGVCKRYYVCKNQDRCLLFIFGYRCLQQKNNGIRAEQEYECRKCSQSSKNGCKKQNNSSSAYSSLRQRTTVLLRDLSKKILRENKIKPSMTDGYDCYKNALAERINGILKQEFLIYKCKNVQDLKQMVKENIYIYNNKRSHLSLKMNTSEKYMKNPENQYLPD